MLHRALAILGALILLAPAPARPGQEPLPDHLLTGLEAMEYEVHATEHGLQAPNRAQDLRTWFGDAGVDIVPRTRDAQWTWSWRTAEWGRAGAMGSPAVPIRHVDGARVEYRRADGLTEWYVNRPDGLEQGFTLTTRPAGGGPVVIAAPVPSGVRATAAPAPDTIDFLDARGEVALRYGGLHAWDAAGRALPSRLEWDDARIRIAVEDDGAAYPVTIDPIANTPSWSRAGGKAQAHFGWSVAAAGDVNGDGYGDVIVGAEGWDGGAVGSGAAFVYHGGPNGLQATGVAWSQTGFTFNGDYGYSVSTAGDVNGDGYHDVIVGEPGWTGNQTNEGRALVYHGSASGLSLVPAWTAEWTEAFAQVGFSVAWAGDVNGDGYDDVLVGIPSDDRTRLPDAGLVQVFYGSASGLATSPSFNILGQEIGEQLGYCVNTAGDVNADGYADIAIGSWKWDGPGTDRGRVQVWLGSASGLTGSSSWSAEGEGDGDSFGSSVATAGDADGDGYADLLVGAVHHSSGATDRGKGYVYRGSASGLSLIPDWTVIGTATDYRVGASCGTLGDVNGDGFADFAFGSPGANFSNGGVVARAGSSALIAGGYNFGNVTQISGDYGHSVATAGDTNGDGFSEAIIGAPYGTATLASEGQAYLYDRINTGFAPHSTDRDSSRTAFGTAVAAGDWNGDGHPDLAASETGAVHAWHGSASGRPDPSTPEVWTVTGSAAAAFGSALANAGDVNGDGYDDLLVGAYLDGASQQGSFFLYEGSASGLSSTPAFSYQDPDGEWLGYSLTGAGDLNDDGYADIAVGMPSADLPSQNEGAVKIWLGTEMGLHSSSMITLEGNRAAALFGWSVACAGDVNGDGHSDLIVGAPGFENQGGVFGGRAFVHLGSIHGIDTSSYWQDWSDGNGDDYGYSVDGAGDVNGDGLADIVVGCPDYDFAPSGDEGTAFVYLAQAGGGFGSPTVLDFTADGVERFGEKVACVGDINADGLSDLVIGAPSTDEQFGRLDEGRICILLGTPAGISTTGPALSGSNTAGEFYGRVIAPAGDVDGDGFADYYVGSPLHHLPVPGAGGLMTYLFTYSFDGTLRRIDLRQLDSTGDPVLHRGNSDLYDGFRVALTGFSVGGRVPLRLELEVTNVATGVTTPYIGPWIDPGVPVAGRGCVVDFDHLVSGLPPGTSCAWRVRVAARSPLFPHGPWFSMQPGAAGLEAIRTRPPVGTDVPVVAETSDTALRVWPNPFREGLTAAIRTTAAGRVRVEVIDVAGRRVTTVVDEPAEAGLQRLPWDGRDSGGHRIASGVYFLRITGPGVAASRKIVRLD